METTHKHRYEMRRGKWWLGSSHTKGTMEHGAEYGRRLSARLDADVEHSVYDEATCRWRLVATYKSIDNRDNP